MGAAPPDYSERQAAPPPAPAAAQPAAAPPAQPAAPFPVANETPAESAASAAHAQELAELRTAHMQELAELRRETQVYHAAAATEHATVAPAARAAASVMSESGAASSTMIPAEVKGDAEEVKEDVPGGGMKRMLSELSADSTSDTGNSV